MKPENSTCIVWNERNSILDIVVCKILKEKSSKEGLVALPIFHLVMSIYVSSIILDYIF